MNKKFLIIGIVILLIAGGYFMLTFSKKHDQEQKMEKCKEMGMDTDEFGNCIPSWVGAYEGALKGIEGDIKVHISLSSGNHYRITEEIGGKKQENSGIFQWTKEDSIITLSDGKMFKLEKNSLTMLSSEGKEILVEGANYTLMKK